MATTPNYGWVTPAPTDFVTDLPADFETFADAVDADLAGLLGGTTGQVLTKDSNTDHDFSWTTISSGGIDNWTLLNAGGTSLTGAATVTVSGISNQKQILCIVSGASSASASSTFSIRPNNDSSANYIEAGVRGNMAGTYSSGNIFGIANYSGETKIEFGQMGTSAGGTVSGSIFIDSADKTGWKRFSAIGGGVSGTDLGLRFTQGIWEGAAAITSISIFSDTGNFDAGTLYVLGAS